MSDVIDAARAVCDTETRTDVHSWWRVDARKIEALRTALSAHESGAKVPDDVQRKFDLSVSSAAMAVIDKLRIELGQVSACVKVQDIIQEHLGPLLAKPTHVADEARVDDAVTAVDKVYRRPRNLDLPTYALIAATLRPYVTATQPGTVAVALAHIREWRCDVHALMCKTPLPKGAKHTDEITTGPHCCGLCDELTALLPPAAAKVPEPSDRLLSAWLAEADKNPALVHAVAQQDFEFAAKVRDTHVAARKAQWVKDRAAAGAKDGV